MATMDDVTGSDLLAVLTPIRARLGLVPGALTEGEVGVPWHPETLELDHQAYAEAHAALGVERFWCFTCWKKNSDASGTVMPTCCTSAQAITPGYRCDEG